MAIPKPELSPGIPYHTIMGDRGRGDAPNSSDGVVPYWSSHMDGAKSELIVPSAHQNPQTIRGSLSHSCAQCAFKRSLKCCSV